MVDVSHPVPAEGHPPEVMGQMKWTCCGKEHLQEGQFTKVVCPYCRVAYFIGLKAIPPVDAKYPPGTRLRLIRETVVQVGNQKFKYEKGEEVVVGYDPHGILGTLEEETLVERQSRSSITDRMRILLTPIPNDALEEVTPASSP